MNILCWEGYNTDDVLGPFRKAHPGASVRAESGTSDPDMINKLRAREINARDLINVNQPWARDQLYPENLIGPLNKERFMPCFEKMSPEFAKPYPLAFADDGNLLGMPQRYGPFSFVVNTDKISRKMAEDEGWSLFLDPAMKGCYGILTYDNWNVIHMCLTAGLNPFAPVDEAGQAKFRTVAEQLFDGAKLLTDDLVAMNTALINGEIDAYFTGGTYTASPAERRRRAMELLDMLRLPQDYYGKGVAQCSGGERQPVALARALAFDPEILFFDEPLSALDYRLRKTLEKELKDLHARTGKTFVYITHSLEEAMVMSDRIAIMRNGRFEQIAIADEIYSRPVSRFVAEFMGEVNLFDVTGAENGGLISADGALYVNGNASGMGVQLAAGEAAESKILGGLAVIVIADDVETAFTFGQNWPLGSALSVLLILIIGGLAAFGVSRVDLDAIMGRRR